jgi:hypothetical protein
MNQRVSRTAHLSPIPEVSTDENQHGTENERRKYKKGMPRLTPIALSRAHLCGDREMEVTSGTHQTSPCKKSQAGQ